MKGTRPVILNKRTEFVSAENLPVGVRQKNGLQAHNSSRSRRADEKTNKARYNFRGSDVKRTKFVITALK